MSDRFDPYHVWLGIPPEEQPPNHYRLLGLRPFETNLDVISNALDQRRAFLRSVQAGKRGAQSQQLLNEVSAAGVALLDGAKKTRYDEELRNKLAPPPSAPAPQYVSAGLPHPMSPLAPASFPPKIQSPLPAFRTPPVVSRGKKRSSPSVIIVAAAAGSCIGIIGLLFVGGIWWARSHTTSPSIAASPTTQPSLPASPSPAIAPEVQPETTAAPARDHIAIKPPPTLPSPSIFRNPEKPSPSPAVPRPPTSEPAIIAPPQPATPTSSASSLPVDAGRKPVPDSSLLMKGEDEARKIYASEFKTATKPPQQAALAKQILTAGRAAQSDFNSRFVLIDLARTLFVKAGEVFDALAAARLLEIEYDIPRGQLVTTTIESLDDVQLVPEARLELTKTVADLADTAADAEEFERADKLSQIAGQSATKLKDAELRKELAQRRAHITRLLKEWNAVKASLEKLKRDPADAAANLAAGKFYCFSLEDFNRGLKYLAASGEGPLAEAAKRDVEAQDGDSAIRLAAAAAWQQAEGKIVDREDKLVAQRRERWLLERAVTGLSGLERVKADKRLNELSNVGAAVAGRKPKPGEMPAKTKKKKTTPKSSTMS